MGFLSGAALANCLVSLSLGLSLHYITFSRQHLAVMVWVCVILCGIVCVSVSVLVLSAHVCTICKWEVGQGFSERKAKAVRNAAAGLLF